ncbi:hypothetical protein HYALB_00006523 [Hymenoscyphus albidus]|uniref:Uncharacterized protein n=1 Tax=Hymenoscyphus albidus TaxID=595503 RepID=A0A9N9LI47_9HELO|nr:hypothetical protein HYALB_00006523 [Hymenoscyphus albidus]
MDPSEHGNPPKKREASSPPPPVSPTSKSAAKKAKSGAKEPTWAEASPPSFIQHDSSSADTNTTPIPIPTLTPTTRPASLKFNRIGSPHAMGMKQRASTFIGIPHYGYGISIEEMVSGIQIPAALLPTLQPSEPAQSAPSPLMGIKELIERGLLPSNSHYADDDLPEPESVLLPPLPLSDKPIESDDHEYRTFREVVWDRYFQVFEPRITCFDHTWLNWLRFLGLLKLSNPAYNKAKIMNVDWRIAKAVEGKWKDESSAKRRVVEYLADRRQKYDDEHQVPSREYPDNLHRVKALTLEEIESRFSRLQALPPQRSKLRHEKVSTPMITETTFNTLVPLIRLDVVFKAKVVAKYRNPPALSWMEFEIKFRIYSPECFVLAEDYQVKFRQWLRKLGLNRFPFNFCHGYEHALTIVELSWNEIDAEKRNQLATRASKYKEKFLIKGSKPQHWYFLEGYYGFSDNMSVFDPIDTRHRGQRAVDPDYKIKKELWLKHIGLVNEDGGYVTPDELLRRWRSKTDTERIAIEDKAREERVIYCGWQRGSKNLDGGPTGRKPVTILDS